MTTCNYCESPLSPEDATYDDRTGHYYCGRACFLDWADENFELITEFYERMNVH